MKELKNIIIINDFNYSQGGASKVAIDTANLLIKKGYNCIFISAVSDDRKSTLDRNVIQYKFNGIEFLQYKNKIKGLCDGVAFKRFSKFVETVILKYNPEDTIIHVHSWTKACSSDFFNILRKLNFKTFLTLHEYFSFCPNGAYFNYKKSMSCNKKGCSLNCLICNCDSRNYLFKVYRFIRELKYKKDINYKYINVIYVSEFEKNIISNKVKIPYFTVIENPISKLKEIKSKKEFDFVYIGRTSKEKGIELFIKLSQKMKDKKFLIVGNYDLKTDNLYSTGWVTENEVENYLSKSKILVFPSLWPETFGLNVVKALAIGIPCLVSSNTAAEDYVINGKNGYIFKQNNFDDMLDKANKIISIPENNGYYKTSLLNSNDRLINYFKNMNGDL